MEPKKSMCREFILTKESEQFICKHANTVDIQVPQPVIVIDESTRCNSENIESPKWLEVHGITLYQTERDAFMGNDWLNDLHIHAAKSMIKNQFPHIFGLNTTLMQDSMSPLTNGALQIIHIDSNHWVTTSTVNRESCDIVVYDPKHTSVSEEILAKLVYTDKPTFSMKMARVTKQSGSCDCGLFAIAYITHIAFGLEPSNYVFDQSKMRTHFTQSLEKKLIEPFPILKEKRTTLSSTVIDVEVHCYCRRPYNGQQMVQCNGDCHQWYHLECIKRAAAVQRKQKWFCRNCTK